MLIRLRYNAVEVVIEADADLCRIGYGDGKGLEKLLVTAERLGATLYRQSGVRLCVLEIDGERIIFPPTPRLVEEPITSAVETILSPSQGESLHEQILAPPDQAPQPLTQAAVQNVVENSPAQPFDLARQVRVLSAEFAEELLRAGFVLIWRNRRKRRSLAKFGS